MEEVNVNMVSPDGRAEGNSGHRTAPNGLTGGRTCEGGGPMDPGPAFGSGSMQRAAWWERVMLGLPPPRVEDGGALRPYLWLRAHW